MQLQQAYCCGRCSLGSFFRLPSALNSNTVPSRSVMTTLPSTLFSTVMPSELVLDWVVPVLASMFLPPLGLLAAELLPPAEPAEPPREARESEEAGVGTRLEAEMLLGVEKMLADFMAGVVGALDRLPPSALAPIKRLDKTGAAGLAAAGAVSGGFAGSAGLAGSAAVAAFAGSAGFAGSAVVAAFVGSAGVAPGVPKAGVLLISTVSDFAAGAGDN